MGIYVFKKSLMLDLLDAVSERARGQAELETAAWQPATAACGS
jgi:ADP-glucose pyrophosphorylase